MKELTGCPYCAGDLNIKEVECSGCNTQIRGSFRANRFQIFSSEELFFIETFLKNEGNIKLVEKDLNISYPTVKNRLKSIIKNLGYKSVEYSPDQKVRVLSDLADSKISVKDAIKVLEGKE